MDRVSVNYGTLLLDPKNITVDASGSSGGSLDNGLRAQVYYNYFNDSFSYFGSVGGRTQDSRSSVRNRFNRDFTTINYITPGRNFAEGILQSGEVSSNQNKQVLTDFIPTVMTLVGLGYLPRAGIM